MLYSVFESQVVEFEKKQKNRKIIKSFANKLGALLVIIGVLTIGYGVLATFLTTPEETVKLNLPIFTDLWGKLFILSQKIAVALKISIIYSNVSVISMLLCAVFAILAATLSTGLFAIAVYCISTENETVDKPLTIENATELSKRLAETKKDIYLKNKAMNIVFWIGSVAMFAFAIYQTNGVLLNACFSSLMLSLPLFIVYLIIRSVFFGISNTFSKERSTVEKRRLESELNEIINTLKQEKEQQERQEKEEQVRKQKEEVERIKKENLAKAKVLYEEATAGEEVDAEKLSQAAVLGNPDAALLVAQQLFLQAVSDEYTKSEQKGYYELVYKTLAVLELYGNHTADTKFLYLSAQFQLEMLDTVEKCKSALAQLRHMRKSGELSEIYNETCTMLIQFLVKNINEYDDDDEDNSYTPVNHSYPDPLPKTTPKSTFGGSQVEDYGKFLEKRNNGTLTLEEEYEFMRRWG